jgi:hypothetical protein
MICTSRNNGFMVPTGFVHQGQLAIEITKARQKLGRDVVHVSYNLGSDASGEPSIFFRITLTDVASREDRLAEATGRVATILFDEIHPFENWGLNPYFNFRSQTEQQKSNDPEWN